MLANADWIVIAALLVDAHNMDVSIHEMPRNRAAEDKIKAAVAQFWEDVATGREPEPDFAKDADVLRAMWKREAEPIKMIDLSGNNEFGELLAERAFLKNGIKSAEARCEAIESQLRYAMKDAAAVTGLDGWRITYKTSHFKEHTVPARDQRVLRIADQREKEA
jgi:predicted phage-related endonuclease